MLKNKAKGKKAEAGVNGTGSDEPDPSEYVTRTSVYRDNLIFEGAGFNGKRWLVYNRKTSKITLQTDYAVYVSNANGKLLIKDYHRMKKLGNTDKERLIELIENGEKQEFWKKRKPSGVMIALIEGEKLGIRYSSLVENFQDYRKRTKP